LDELKPRADTVAIFVLVTITSIFYYILVLNSETNVTGKGTEVTPDVKSAGEKGLVIETKSNVLIDAPIIKQYPELPRGCEVTSLAMLLQYKGINVGKMELAQRVEKNKTPMIKKNGYIYWGDPNEGFIGDIYSLKNPGYGVYHKPIFNLANRYLRGKIIDLTGSEFEVLKRYLSHNSPIWVITNTTYKKLPEKAFHNWKTPNGIVKITYKEHSVLVTGYDEKNVYFNDPISGLKNRSISIKDFIEAWEQMGRQAISIHK
jgi:uncharacterized protein YvpB